MFFITDSLKRLQNTRHTKPALQQAKWDVKLAVFSMQMNMTSVFLKLRIHFRISAVNLEEVDLPSCNSCYNVAALTPYLVYDRIITIIAYK